MHWIYESMTEEEIMQAEVDAINANAQLVVIYRDSNTKIAEAEAFLDSYYDEYYGVTEYSIWYAVCLCRQFRG